MLGRVKAVARCEAVGARWRRGEEMRTRDGLQSASMRCKPNCSMSANGEPCDERTLLVPANASVGTWKFPDGPVQRQEWYRAPPHDVIPRLLWRRVASRPASKDPDFYVSRQHRNSSPTPRPCRTTAIEQPTTRAPLLGTPRWQRRAAAPTSPPAQWPRARAPRQRHGEHRRRRRRAPRRTCPRRSSSSPSRCSP